MNRTVDDVSSDPGDEPPVPAIVMVATGAAPASLVLTVPAELGRRIAAAGKAHEIEDDRMSRDHALVTTDRGLWVISDRDSRNGTFVDGERILGEVRRRGDVVVRLGHTLFILVADGGGAGHGSDGPADQVVDPELAASPMAVHGEPGSGEALAAQLAPPLRTRKLDIARLVQREVAAVSGKLAPHAKLVEACCLRPWPGQLRELGSAVRQAASEAIAAGRDVVRLEDLSATAGMPLCPTPTTQPSGR